MFSPGWQRIISTERLFVLKRKAESDACNEQAYRTEWLKE